MDARRLLTVESGPSELSDSAPDAYYSSYDLNGNEHFEPQDALLVINAVNDGTAYDAIPNTDFNRDEVIDDSDVELILTALDEYAAMISGGTSGGSSSSYSTAADDYMAMMSGHNDLSAPYITNSTGDSWDYSSAEYAAMMSGGTSGSSSSSYSTAADDYMAMMSGHNDLSAPYITNSTGDSWDYSSAEYAAMMNGGTSESSSSSTTADDYMAMMSGHGDLNAPSSSSSTGDSWDYSSDEYAAMMNGGGSTTPTPVLEPTVVTTTAGGLITTHATEHASGCNVSASITTPTEVDEGEEFVISGSRHGFIYHLGQMETQLHGSQELITDSWTASARVRDDIPRDRPKT